MSTENVYGLDLNLLLALHALLEEEHVTHAAERFGRTQSAMSRSLARLRDLLGDPLLVRTRRGMRPTARALALRDPVRRLVADAAAIVGGGFAFEPRTARRTFTISCADATETLLMPALLGVLATEAPGVDVRTRRESRFTEEQLELGQLDLAVVPAGALSESSALRTQRLYRNRFVSIARKGHPALRKEGLDLATYCALPHALSAPLGTPGSVVDDALRLQGRSRRVAYAGPGFLAVGHVVAQSDLIATLPERSARHLAAYLPLRVFPVPVPLAPFAIHQQWHERRHHDPGHVWLRSRIKSLVGDGEGSPLPAAP
ncbi:MAG: LysR family transcriptional regulator [Myxococcota bacterium]